MGQFLSIYGEAIYGSKPWRAQNDSMNPNVWYTCQPTEAVYMQAIETAAKLKATVRGRKSKTAPKNSTLQALEEKMKMYEICNVAL